MKIRLRILQCCSFLLSLLPLLLTIALRWDHYVRTPTDLFGIFVSGIIAVIFVIYKVFDKLKAPRRIIKFAAVFALSYFLRSLTDDLVLLSGMALLGEFLDLVLLSGSIHSISEKIALEKSACATADKVEVIVEKALDKYMNGRV